MKNNRLIITFSYIGVMLLCGTIALMSTPDNAALAFGAVVRTRFRIATVRATPNDRQTISLLGGQATPPSGYTYLPCRNVIEGISFEREQYTSAQSLAGGTTAEIGTYFAGYKSSGSVSPAICTSYQPVEAVALSPSGERFAASTNQQYNGMFSTQLPLVAFSEPGIWTLAVGNTLGSLLYINVPAFNYPTYLLENDQVLLLGFRPHERVAGVLFDQSNPLTYRTHFMLNVDINGQALINDPRAGSSDAGTILVFVSENRNFLFPVLGRSRDYSRDEALYQALFAAPPEIPTQVVSASSCPGFNLPSRLVIGGRGRVTPGDPNALNSLPAPRSRDPQSIRLGLIPAGGVFTVLDGPVCNYGYVWWYVEYRGKRGWTAEGEGNTYWLEVVP